MKLRLANIDDAEDLLQWRNDPLTRKMSVTPERIEKENHMSWYKKALANPDIKIYIAEDKNGKLGMVRFDRKGNQAETSINLNPEFRGQKLGEPILSGAIEKMKEHWKIETLKAIIKSQNKASIALFKKCSFVVSSRDEIIHIYIRTVANE